MRRLVPGLLAFVLGCGGAPVRPPPVAAPAPATYRVIDATGPFWSFWERAKALPVAEQRTIFRETVIAPNPSLFAESVLGEPTPAALDEQIDRWLPTLPARIDAMRAITRTVREDLARHDTSFRRAFPDMRWSGRVYFTVSIDAFDGAVRKVDGTPALTFGIDKIAKLYGPDAKLEALFHHELFHIYHDQVALEAELHGRDPHGFLYPLWAEGLAVVAAKALNPGADAKALLLSPEMIRDTKPKLALLAKELLAGLDDTTEESYRDFFLGRGTRPDVPRRCGYLVGYVVAMRIVGRHGSIAEAARLRSPQLRVEVAAALGELANGGAATELDAL